MIGDVSTNSHKQAYKLYVWRKLVSVKIRIFRDHALQESAEDESDMSEEDPELELSSSSCFFFAVIFFSTFCRHMRRTVGLLKINWGCHVWRQWRKEFQALLTAGATDLEVEVVEGVTADFVSPPSLPFFLAVARAVYKNFKWCRVYKWDKRGFHIACLFSQKFLATPDLLPICDSSLLWVVIYLP